MRRGAEVQLIDCVWCWQMSFAECVFYYWSDKEWDSCDKFREAAEKVLNPKNLPGMLEWSASDTQVCGTC
jgi:hypothetical protein